MFSSLLDIETLQSSDADSSPSPRGILRVGRRIAKRCWLDQQTIKQRRIFCQNSGGCGSTYIVHLLKLNGIERSFHEKKPDLLQTGLDHYEHALSQPRLIRLLRYTRHNVFFEANNRLFSLTEQLAGAFPNASFLHLYREAAESIRAAMSKQNLADYVANDTRFRGTLAGPQDADMFARFCHHWANMNRRIHDDLKRVEARGFVVRQMRFEDLVKGNVEVLEESLDHELKTRIVDAVNVRPVRTEGRFPTFDDWTISQKEVFNRICRPVAEVIRQT